MEGWDWVYGIMTITAIMAPFILFGWWVGIVINKHFEEMEEEDNNKWPRNWPPK